MSKSLGKRGRPSNAERASRPVKDRQQREKEKKQRRRAKRNAQQPSPQYNFVDPDSRVMKDNGQKAFVQAYNAQIAVDSQAQIIVAAELTQQTRSSLGPSHLSLSTFLGGFLTFSPTHSQAVPFRLLAPCRAKSKPGAA
jgi:hypothetical protein